MKRNLRSDWLPEWKRWTHHGHQTTLINHFDYVQHKNFLETQRAAEESQDEENIHDSQGFMYCARNTVDFPSRLSK